MQCYSGLGAIEDSAFLIRRNPARIEKAGHEKSPERPVLTVEEVLACAEHIEPRYRFMVLLAAFAQLRFGEFVRLHRSDFDVEAGTVRVGEAKSEAGVRTVAIPTEILPDAKIHLAVYAEQSGKERVFVGPRKGTPTTNNFSKIWHAAMAGAGVDPVHFHDLRHTGNTLVAESGASLKELMRRMGHSSTRAAMIYQHATDKRDRVLAESLSEKIKEARKPRSPKTATGT